MIIESCHNWIADKCGIHLCKQQNANGGKAKYYNKS